VSSIQGFSRTAPSTPQAPIEQAEFPLDIRDFDLNKIADFDVVVHLAGISNDPLGALNPAQVYDPTREYTKAVASSCKKFGKRFIFSSSCSVYGKATSELVDESSKPNPQTPYSLNKLQIEEDLLEMCDSSFHPIMLRFATVYGISPFYRLDLVVNMLVAMSVTHGKLILNSDGKALRPHLHIQDAAQSVSCAVEIESLDSPILVNVGRDEDNLSILDLAKRISSLAGDIPIEFMQHSESKSEDLSSSIIKDRKIQNGADTRSYNVSFAKIKKTFPSFSCKWDLQSGIKDLRQRLVNLGFRREDFENQKFYRLQTIESLFNQGKLDSALRWL
jgi:nucleoside-diphosphate-sugar epimerase